MHKEKIVQKIYQKFSAPSDNQIESYEQFLKWIKKEEALEKKLPENLKKEYQEMIQSCLMFQYDRQVEAIRFTLEYIQEIISLTLSD